MYKWIENTQKGFISQAWKVLLHLTKLTQSQEKKVTPRFSLDNDS